MWIEVRWFWVIEVHLIPTFQRGPSKEEALLFFMAANAKPYHLHIYTSPAPSSIPIDKHAVLFGPSAHDIEHNTVTRDAEVMSFQDMRQS